MQTYYECKIGNGSLVHATTMDRTDNNRRMYLALCGQVFLTLTGKMYDPILDRTCGRCNRIVRGY